MSDKIGSFLFKFLNEKKIGRIPLILDIRNHIHYFVKEEKNWPTFLRATDKCDFKTIKAWFESLV